jgi:hypothetical protein
MYVWCYYRCCDKKGHITILDTSKIIFLESIVYLFAQAEVVVYSDCLQQKVEAFEGSRFYIVTLTLYVTNAALQRGRLQARTTE